MKKKLLSFIFAICLIIPCALFVGCTKDKEPADNATTPPVNEVKVLLSDDGKTLYRFAPDNDEIEYTVPEGIEIIEASAFEDCDNLTKVTLPTTLKSVREEAFKHCNKLRNVEISSDIWVGDEAFSCCHDLCNIDVSRIIYLGSYSFYECNDLTSVTIAKEITNLYEGVFAETDNLTTINFEQNSSLKAIETKAFQKSGLTSIDLPTTCIFIGNRAFQDSGLTNITIGKNIETIESYAFAECADLLTVEFETGRTKKLYFSNEFYDSEYGHTFSECSKLVSVTNYPSETDIVESMFWGCRKLETFTFTEDDGTYDSLYLVENGAFYYCDSLEEIYLPTYFESIIGNAFHECTALNTVIINSETVANSLIEDDDNGYLAEYATTIYIKTGLTTTNSTYLLTNFTKQATSDKTGYDMYVRNA